MSGSASERESGRTSFEDLVASFVERRRRGEHPSLDAFAELHPEHARQIREFFPLLDMLEDRSEPAAPARALPEDFGEFRLIRPIGRGGMGVVYEAEQTSLRRRVALKVMAGAGVPDPARWERFRREAEIASRLEHPGICGIHGAGIVDGTPYLAMRLVEGHDLGVELAAAASATRLEESTLAPGAAATSRDPGPHGDRHLPVPEPAELRRRVRLVEEVARTLHAAHEAGIVHRDIKPGNVMVTPDDHAVILDFGLARDLLGDQPTLTRTGDVCGTPAYMAPEQIASRDRRPDRRTDVYALGVMLYECVTGRRPFSAPTRDVLYRSILEEEPPAPRRINRAIGEDLATVIETAMAKDAADRYATAEALAQDLGRVLRREPVSVRPIGPWSRSARWARRHPRRAAAAAAFAVLLAVAAGLGGFLWAQRGEAAAGRRQALAARIDALLEEGWLQHAEGSRADARAAFAAALELDAGRLEALQGLAMAARTPADQEDVLRRLDRNPVADAPAAAGDRIRAGVLRAMGRAGEADGIEGSLPPPAAAVEWFLIGTSRMPDCHRPEVCDFGLAVEAFRNAVLRSGKAQALYHLGLAHAAGHARDDRAAREAAGALRALWPASANAAYQRGLALLHVGDSGGALESFREALALRPEHGPSLFGVAEVLLARGDLDGALAAARRAVAALPRDARAHHDLGRVHQKRRELPDAIDSLRRALGLDRGFAPAWEGLGSVFFESGDYGEAESAFRNALELRPGSAPAWTGLAQTLIRLGRPGDAEAAARKAVEIAPAAAEGLRVLALAQLQSGDAAAAAETAGRATRAEPGNVLAWVALGRALLGTGDAAPALDALRHALDLDPRHAVARFSLAFALRTTGAVDEALVELETSAAADPTFADPCQEASTIHLGLKRWPEAEAAAREALRRRPAFPEAWCNLGLALRSQERCVEALEALRRGHELGSETTGWSHPSARWVEEAALRVAEGDERLAAYRERGELPGAAAERAALAVAAGERECFALEARIWRQVIDAGPEEKSRHRLQAAAAAFRAAAGEGRDAPPSEADRSRHSAEARALVEEVLAWFGTRAEDPGDGDGRAARILRRWIEEPAFAGLRSGVAPAGLPASEQDAWRALWARLASLDRAARD